VDLFGHLTVSRVALPGMISLAVVISGDRHSLLMMKATPVDAPGLCG
jgi:hypothetical protein